MTERTRIVVVMGPSGCGKSTVGTIAADIAEARFFEADDYHSEDAKAIMASGHSLTDAQREPWIGRVADAITAERPERSVLACSALNPTVRALMREKLPSHPVFLYLHVPQAVLARRLEKRRGHFAGPSFLSGQLAALDSSGTERLDGTLPARALAEAVAAHLR